MYTGTVHFGPCGATVTEPFPGMVTRESERERKEKETGDDHAEERE